MLLRIGCFPSVEPENHRRLWSGQSGEARVELWYPNAKQFAKRIEIKQVESPGRLAFAVGAIYPNCESVTPVDETTLQSWLDEFHRTGSKDFLKEIDGCFTLVLIDLNPLRILVAGDIRSLFPVYYASEGQNFSVSWRISDILNFAGVRPTRSLGSMLSALTNGLLIGSNTYHQNIRRLFPGEYLLYQNGTLTRDRYWRRDFSRPGSVSAEEFAEVITMAVKTEIARAGKDGLLALSGGIDSRALLAVIARGGITMDSITWGCDRLDLEFGDFQAGAKLARHVGLPHRGYPLDPDRLGDHLKELVLETEGRLLHVGSFPHGEEFPQELAERYGTIFFGAHCLGMGYRGYGLGQALLGAGIRTGLYVRAAATLFQSPFRRQALAEYRAQIEEFVAPYRSLPVGDIQDLMDYQHTSPGMEAAIHWIWSKHLYPSCPLTTRRVMDLCNHFTREQRADKAFLAQTIQKTLWPGEPWPTNTKHSRINWEHRIQTGGKMARDLTAILTTPGPFYDIFDRNQIFKWLKFTMPWADIPEPSAKSTIQTLLNRFLWQRTRSIQLTHLAVMKLAGG
jgi:hypothetical protein